MPSDSLTYKPHLSIQIIKVSSSVLEVLQIPVNFKSLMEPEQCDYCGKFKPLSSSFIHNILKPSGWEHSLSYVVLESHW